MKLCVVRSKQHQSEKYDPRFLSQCEDLVLFYIYISSILRIIIKKHYNVEDIHNGYIKLFFNNKKYYYVEDIHNGYIK